MSVYNQELKSNQPKTRSVAPPEPSPENTSFIIVDLLKKQYIFSSVPKDIKTLPVEFEDDNVLFNTTSMNYFGAIISNKGITTVDDSESHKYFGNILPLLALESFKYIIVNNKPIKFG